MSHFCVYVFQDKNSPSVDDLLAPYDENLVMEKYIEYTKEQAIAYVRKDIEDYKLSPYYKEFTADPVAYEKKCSSNPAHLKYLKDEFPKRLKWTDEECYDYLKSNYGDDLIDSDGNLYSDYNPNSKWDWYEVGGRWDGELKTRYGSNVNVCRVSEIDPETTSIPFAFVTPEGKRVEHAKMGWWNEDDQYESKFREYIKGLGKSVKITVVDCHI